MAKADPLPKRYLTRNEVCRYLGLCLASVEKLIKQRYLRPIKILSEYRFDIYDIDNWMASSRVDERRP